MVSAMVKEPTLISKEISTLENGSMTCQMDTELRTGQLGNVIQEVMSMELSVEKESINGLMAPLIMESGKTIYKMAMVCINS